MESRLSLAQVARNASVSLDVARRVQDEHQLITRGPDGRYSPESATLLRVAVQALQHLKDKDKAAEAVALAAGALSSPATWQWFVVSATQSRLATSMALPALLEGEFRGQVVSLVPLAWADLR